MGARPCVHALLFSGYPHVSVLRISCNYKILYSEKELTERSCWTRSRFQNHATVLRELGCLVSGNEDGVTLKFFGWIWNSGKALYVLVKSYSGKARQFWYSPILVL